MSLVVAVRGWDPAPWLARFRRLAPPGLAVVDGREPFDATAIRWAAVWKPEPGFLAGLPNLRAVFNLGAGVDALLGDPTLPEVPVARIVDPDLTARMTEWVVMHVLMHHRRVATLAEAQARAEWLTLYQPAAGAVRVGIMGLGVLGRDAAAVLRRLGFRVAGWSRTPQEVPGIDSFAGTAGLDAFLGATDILVVLLPATPETRGILRRDLFARLGRGAHMGGPVLINAGRGSLQVEADILAALDDGTLGAASLDVFEHEPLPTASPLWRHPRVFVSPHAAADSDPEALVAQIVDGIAAVERGEPLPHRVDRGRGY
ncbi:glyoxylate/hydroxypyruvate reductase A [Siculibacillus lacustris]|uniref:Glyoxylate/hydroxypyruvate reductase A n=1 Tax=Siculibacillus lacustris TaxID=1549641 RepID=A0A4Q9VTA2_9HYPH|nr:glyoxylate/hydroxypyruvate reductase A [Siculibacillus lacustris]TBW39277.1 glyoxylate/hydroxypyruvate reductase A [Siculibacillus lacustris]